MWLLYIYYCTWYAYTTPTLLSLKPPVKKGIGVTSVVVAFAKIIAMGQETFAAVIRVPLLLQPLAAELN